MRLWVSGVMPEGAAGGGCARALERVELRRVLGDTLEGRAADHVEGRVTWGLSLGRLRAPALWGHELRTRVCARKATGTAPAAPQATKALKPLELRCPVQRRH